MPNPESMMKVLIAALLGFLLVSSNAANAATSGDFIAACRSWSNLEESICECMADKAKKRLSPNGFDFVAASMQRNDAETSRLRSKLSFGELMATGTFMASGPGECAGGPVGHSH
jgi:hypothetical protein